MINKRRERVGWEESDKISKIKKYCPSPLSGRE
jgi:hypothetical protein